MTYNVIARAWRPQRFGDVVGQNHVTDTLKNAIRTKRIAHAFLFVGPRGIGKTSIARILAKALNCNGGPSVEPCNKCDSCREIAESRNLDVVEIDGASNNSVDQIRDLRDTVQYLPTRGPFKIYIIDEVHMLSSAAFNALLKTLEEPPAHVKFIFATTEPQKVLPTIISRCQRFDLRRIPSPKIVERLAEIAKSEKIKCEPAALAAIARGADGGLRDAESALDQIVSFKGDTISESDVLEVFGLMSGKALDQMVECILKGDVSQLMKIVSALDEEGRDLQRVTSDLLLYFRNLLICSCKGADISLIEAPVDEVKRVKELSGLTGQERLLRIVDILVDCDRRLRYGLSRRALFEAALIRSARTASVVSIEQVLDEVVKLRDEIGGGAVVAAGTAVPSPAHKPEAVSASTAEAVPKAPAGRTAVVKEINVRELLKNDTIRKTVDAFGGEIIDVRE